MHGKERTIPSFICIHKIAKIKSVWHFIHIFSRMNIFCPVGYAVCFWVILDPRRISRASTENQMPMPLISACSSDLHFGSSPHYFSFYVIYLRRNDFFWLGFSMSYCGSILKFSLVFHVSLTRFNQWNFFLLPRSIYQLLVSFFHAEILASLKAENGSSLCWVSEPQLIGP